jgi:hypothetical protein
MEEPNSPETPSKKLTIISRKSGLVVEKGPVLATEESNA